MELTNSSYDMSYVMQNSTTDIIIGQPFIYQEVMPMPSFDNKLTGGYKYFAPIQLSDEQILSIEKKKYLQKRDELMAEYGGKFIAMLNGIVLDSDSEFSSLATRVYNSYGYKAILMIKVTKQEEKIKVSPKTKEKKAV